MLVAALLSLFCLLLGYGLGNRHVVADAMVRAELSAQLEALQTQLADMEAVWIDTRLNEQVQQSANDALREDLTLAHQSVARLQEEVTFYKGLMAPSTLRQGLQVAELQLEALPSETGAAAFSYQLLLTQVALRRSFIAGEVRMDVIGQFDPIAGKTDSINTEAVLSLTELSEAKSYPLKFRFRYFQDLAGRLTLPEGFRPDRILVTANQNGKDPLQVTFPWPTSGAQVETQGLASSDQQHAGVLNEHTRPAR